MVHVFLSLVSRQIDASVGRDLVTVADSLIIHLGDQLLRQCRYADIMHSHSKQSGLAIGVVGG